MNIIARGALRQLRLRAPVSIALSRSMTSFTPVYFRFSDAKKEGEEESHDDFKPKVKPAPLKRSSEEIRKELDAVVKGNKIVLFMKGRPQSPMCGYSNFAVELLKFYQVKDYHSVDVLADQQLREEIKVFSNWPTFPQLYVDGNLVGGCDILQEMHKEGSLKGLLQSK